MGKGLGSGKERGGASRRAAAALVALLAGVSPIAITTPAAAQAQSEAVEFDIPAQPLGSALVAYARQAGVQLVMTEEAVGTTWANPVRGVFERQEALSILLRGTGYRARFENGAVRLSRVAQTGERAEEGSTPDYEDDAFAQAPDSILLRGEERQLPNTEEDIVVVGTKIRGAYPASSPVEIYSAEDIAQSGAVTTEQFIQRLPQNVGTRTEYASTATTTNSFNREAVSSIDLRGLGVGTTLTLLNGRRIAPANFGQTVDVSIIPVGAIERVEVLTDGASALYGSDAIGGVVNFVLRDDFDGAETRVSYGGVTSGDLRRGNISQTVGREWGNGNGLLALDYASASSLSASDRDYADTSIFGQADLTPTTQNQTALGSISQDLTADLRLGGLLALAMRDVKNVALLNALGAPTAYRSETFHTFADLGLDADLAENLSASVSLTYSANNVDSSYGAGAVIDTEYSSFDLTAVLNGVLFATPAGSARYAFGASYQEEEYLGTTTANGVTPSGRTLGRTTSAAFAELLLPLIGESQDAPLAHRLEFSVAARYTSYEDASEPRADQEFGDRVSPKIGLLWSPFETLNLRGTYGESFRAPSLSQMDPSGRLFTLQQGAAVGGVSSTVVALGGPADELDAETAETYTIGFDYRPNWLSGFELSGTYFSIDYSDRVAAPSTTAARANPSAWPELIHRPVSADELEEIISSLPNTFNNTGVSLADPEAAAAALFARLPNLWIVDSQTRNLSVSTLEGIDISLQHRAETPIGELTLGVDFTKIFEFVEKASENSPTVSVVDTVGRPADLRGRLRVMLGRDNWWTSLNANYVDGYDNPLAFASAGGPHEVDSWTTLDWTSAVDLQFEGWGRTRLSLTIQNVFDRDPPFVSRGSTLQFSPAFDPANANPLGRVVALSITQAW